MSSRILNCKIAELNTEINILSDKNRLISQSEGYLCEFQEPQIKIGFNMPFLQNRIAELPSLTLSECEYIWTGYDFARQLLAYDGFVLHASAVSYKNKAYLFSAPCGTGKSTHTTIWQRVFGADAVIINDDKPALRLIDGKLLVFGTPWSGKTDLNNNISSPLGGICFISRSDKNHIEKADKRSAVYLLLSQTMRHPKKEFMEQLLDFFDKILDNIPVFKMGCNMEDSAAITAYEYMNKNSKGDDFYED